MKTKQTPKNPTTNTTMPRTLADVQAERAADDAANKGKWSQFVGQDVVVPDVIDIKVESLDTAKEFPKDPNKITRTDFLNTTANEVGEIVLKQYTGTERAIQNRKT